MEYLAGLYTLLLVTICLELAVVLWRTGKKQGGAPDHDELKRWMQQQLDAQAREFAARQSASPSRITPPCAASARRCRLRCRT